jgi:hypothetical protein
VGCSTGLDQLALETNDDGVAVDDALDQGGLRAPDDGNRQEDQSG